MKGWGMSKKVICPKCNSHWFAKTFCTLCKGKGKVSWEIALWYETLKAKQDEISY